MFVKAWLYFYSSFRLFALNCFQFGRNINPKAVFLQFSTHGADKFFYCIHFFDYDNCPAASIGKRELLRFSIFPDSNEAAGSAEWISSSAWGPFIEMNRPSGFTSGRQYSNKILSGATARDTAKSYFSRYFGFLPASSARACTVSAASPSAPSTSCKNKRRLLRLSSRVSLISGRTIKRGIPGKPAPVPTSINDASCGISTNLRGERLSRKCLTATSSGCVMAVRLIFHSIPLTNRHKGETFQAVFRLSRRPTSAPVRLTAPAIASCAFTVLLFCCASHIRSTEISAGLTPLIRDAWPILAGMVLFSFSCASRRKPVIPL